MGEKDSGYYDKRGYWHPPYPCSFSVIWEKPRTLKSILTYFFGWGGYIWPRPALYLVLAVITWHFFQPALAVTMEFQLSWMGLMLLRNIVYMWIIFGAYHLLLYTLKLKGTHRKYNPAWPEKNSKRFLFHNQTMDNIFYSTLSGGLIWTGYEVLYIWAASNGFTPLISWSESPVWFVLFFFLLPMIRESHFYFIQRRREVPLYLNLV